MSEETQAEQKPATDQMELRVTVTTEQGDTVPVLVRVDYPHGRGYTAAGVLENLGQSMDDLYRQLVLNGDAETLRAMEEAKVGQ